MIINNFFHLKKLKHVVLIGWCPNVNDIIKINNKFKLKTTIVTSPNQKNKFDKKIKLKVFEDINKVAFQKFVSKNFEINNTLFISVSSMFIFKKKNNKFFK